MIKCIICGQIFEKSISFCNHILRKHSLKAKDYYDTYLKTDTDGICKYENCNNPTYFINIEHGYKECCCLEHTNLYRYGVKSNFNFEETKAKAQKNSHTEEVNRKGLNTRIERYGGSGFSSAVIKEKIEKTNVERYGVNNAYQNEQVREKSKQTKQHKYNDENFNNRIKAEQTCLEKYGVKHQMQIDSIKDKSKATCKERYGVETILTLGSTIHNAHTAEAQHKRNIANRNKILSGNYKNQIEELFMTLCIQHNIKVIPEYDSEVYPYACDFYMPDKNLYIEINNHWSHNTHWFDSANKNDIDTLNYWKSKNSIYYNRAIDVWTKSDVDKRQIAKNNNLNYVVLWSKNDIKDWFLNNCPIRHDWN